jgi:hypothetical protein
MPPQRPKAGQMMETAAEARRLALESACAMQELGHRSARAAALALMATAELQLGDLEHAQRHVCEALQICAQTGWFEGPLFALSVVALLAADEGAREQAVELYALASRYPFVHKSRWFEAVFGRHIAAVAAALPAEVVAAAEARGRNRDLWATVEELAAELGAAQTPRPAP